MHLQAEFATIFVHNLGHKSGGLFKWTPGWQRQYLLLNEERIPVMGYPWKTGISNGGGWPRLLRAFWLVVIHFWTNRDDSGLRHCDCSAAVQFQKAVSAYFKWSDTAFLALQSRPHLTVYRAESTSVAMSWVLMCAEAYCIWRCRAMLSAESMKKAEGSICLVYKENRYFSLQGSSGVHFCGVLELHDNGGGGVLLGGPPPSKRET